MSRSPTADPVPTVTRLFSMSQVVDRTGVPAATIRYYLAEGLLPPPHKVAANRFLYDDRHVELVRLVRLLRERRGLSLERIGRVLPELLPDLVGNAPTGVFRPEMWSELFAAADPAAAGIPSLRSRLITIAMAAFSERGYADVTVDDVCRAADIAKGSFYRQFSSKEELFLSVAGHVAVSSADTFLARACVGERPLDRTAAVALLADVLGAHLPVLLDLTSLAAQGRPGYPEALRALTTQVSDAIAGAFRDAIVTGSGANSATWAPDIPENDVLAQAIFEGVRRVVAAAPRAGVDPGQRP
jgi:AcrR family transcriptional regulator